MRCDECDESLEPMVCRSAAGYYVGQWCKCGPYDRLSGYYRTHAEAAKVVWLYDEELGLRDPSDDDLRDLAADAKYQERKDNV